MIRRRSTRDFTVEVNLERVEAKDGSHRPVLTHVARAGEHLTVCGKRVMWVIGDHETDTVSMIECGTCKGWVERHTQ